MQTQIAFTDDGMLIVRFETERAYLFPIGRGDLRRAIQGIQADSAARGASMMLFAASRQDTERLDMLFPDRYHYHQNRDFAEYIYNSADLIHLAGKKYHGKRNHISRFSADYPGYTFEEITRGNIDEARAMCDSWYRAYTAEDQTDSLIRAPIAATAVKIYSKTLAMIIKG